MFFLVTAIGSFSADCVINTLKEKGNIVVGCDIYPAEWHAVSKDCAKVYQAPLATREEAYVEFLLDVSLREKITHIVPLTDLEIDVLNKHRDVFVENSVCLCMPEKEVLSVARDKYNLYLAFKDDTMVPSIPTYKTKVDDIPDNLLPCIGKPCNGRSSEGLRKVEMLSELQEVKNKENYVIQEMLVGPVITVDYVRNSRTGNDFCLSREELLRTKNGAGTTVRIFHSKELELIVKHVGNRLDINGCVNMEFIFHEGKYYLMDINPRFSAGVAFSRVAGYNMVTSHVHCFLGMDILPPIEYQEQIVTKRYREEVLAMK